MGQSKYTKRTRAVRQVASGVGTDSGTTRIALNRDWLVAEHRVNILATQTYAGGAPTSLDVRDFIASVSVETSDGRRIFLTGPQAYDIGRFTESGSAVVASPFSTGANTAQFNIDLHYENDSALLDLATALRSNELTTLDLVITFKPLTDNGWKGGTTATATVYNITVESVEYEMLAEQQFGFPLGAFKHTCEKQEVAGTATGSQPDFLLVTGNDTRFIMLHVYDTSGAKPVLSDAIVTDLRLNINSRDYRLTNFASLRRDNAADRGFNQVGVACFDFGDDEAGFLKLTDVNQAKLSWTVAAGAPAWNVKLLQDYTRKA